MQWMKAMTDYASSELQRDFIKAVVLPHFYFSAPQVYLSEVLIAVSLILGPSHRATEEANEAELFGKTAREQATKKLASKRGVVASRAVRLPVLAEELDSQPA
jgi:hypothetical protein